MNKHELSALSFPLRNLSVGTYGSSEQSSPSVLLESYLYGSTPHGQDWWVLSFWADFISNEQAPWICLVLVNLISTSRAASGSLCSIPSPWMYSSHSPHSFCKPFVKPLPALNYHYPREISTSRKRLWAPVGQIGCTASEMKNWMKNWPREILVCSDPALWVCSCILSVNNACQKKKKFPEAAWC